MSRPNAVGTFFIGRVHVPYGRCLRIAGSEAHARETESLEIFDIMRDFLIFSLFLMWSFSGWTATSTGIT